jgi:hypothetical protein
VELRKVELLGLAPWAQALVTGGTILRLLGPGPPVTKTPARVMPSTRTALTRCRDGRCGH